LAQGSAGLGAAGAMMRSASAPDTRAAGDDKTAPERALQDSIGGEGAWSTGQLASLYATPSFCSLYADSDDPEPGPGAYEILSSLGAQPESTKQTAISTSLTAKHGKAWSKVLITKYHNCEKLCRESPGAGTYQPKLLKSQAGVKMSSGMRSNIAAGAGDRSPGPVYDVRTRPEARTNVKFGQDDRFRQEGEPTPGPGQYEALTAFDGNRLAKSFGTSFVAYRKVKTPGIERELRGRTSPGPGVYQENFGKNLPQFTFQGVRSFPRAERMPHRIGGPQSRIPGPGAYDNVKVLEVAKPTCASSLVMNPAVRTFGKPSTKPRLDFKQLRLFSNTTWGMN